MFVVEIGSVITTATVINNFFKDGAVLFPMQVSIWLLATVIFANFAEAFAETKGKARAESLRSTKNLLIASRISENGKEEQVSAALLKKGDIIAVHEGDTIPGDGDIIEGTALVDESAITGESAPVIRESGGDRCGVTGGTKLLSGNIKVRIAVNQGESFLDSMIKMVKAPRDRNLLMNRLWIYFSSHLLYCFWLLW